MDDLVNKRLNRLCRKGPSPNKTHQINTNIRQTPQKEIYSVLILSSGEAPTS